MPRWSGLISNSWQAPESLAEDSRSQSGVKTAPTGAQECNDRQQSGYLSVFIFGHPY